MGIKSVINTERLYWLGRYTERVYTTLILFSKSFDSLIEQGIDSHAEFCRALEISDIYADKDDFIAKYAFSLDDENSINSNLMRAYDNAIELRQEIGSDTLSYIQMAVYEMRNAEKSDAPLLNFQTVADCLLAFWGCVDDQIDDENTRNIIKIGKRVERLDLYARLRRPKADIEREIFRLAGRIDRTELIYNHSTIQRLKQLVASQNTDYEAVVRTVEGIMECEA